MVRGLFCAGFAFAVGVGTALAQTPPLPDAKPDSLQKLAQSGKADSKPAAKPGDEPARAAAAEIPATERLAIQSALLWTGDYTGAIGTTDGMREAVKSFQKRNKSKITGALAPDERAVLLKAAERHEEEFGWSVVVDPITGIRLGLPEKMVPHARAVPNGTRWSSKRGEIQVETFRIKAGVKLSELYEREKKEPASRKVDNRKSALNGDNFFITGMQGLKYFTVRAHARNGEIRGFTMLYDQALVGIVAPVMVAMTSTFAPFPERSAPLAVLPKAVEYGTGLVVNERGHIITDRRNTQNCQVLVVRGLGNAEHIADDKARGLALLRVYGVRKLPAVALAGAPAKLGELKLIGIPDPHTQDGVEPHSEIEAQLHDGEAIVLAQPVPVAGFSGAAALAVDGRVLGIMQARTMQLASAEPTLPPVRLITAASIRAFLDAHKVPHGDTVPAADARAAVVRIICVRE